MGLNRSQDSSSKCQLLIGLMTKDKRLSSISGVKKIVCEVLIRDNPTPHNLPHGTPLDILYHVYVLMLQPARARRASPRISTSLIHILW